jgi:hypothetical protein
MAKHFAVFTSKVVIFIWGHCGPTLIIVALSLAMGQCGGDRYELKQDKAGRTVRLDKKTGEVAVVYDDRLVKVRSPEEQQAEHDSIESASLKFRSPKFWPVQSIAQLGVVKAELQTMWIDGNLKYRLYMSPPPKNFSKMSTWSAKLFELRFNDPYLFVLIKKDLYASEFSRTVDVAGKAVGISTDGDITCSQETYKSLGTFELLWY